MSWSNHWNQPPPPPPGPPGGPHMHPPPPPHPPHPPHPPTVWDFMRGLDPSQAPGAGVDHAAGSPPPVWGPFGPNSWAGFPWAGGPGGPGGWDEGDRGRGFPFRFRGGGPGRRGGRGEGRACRHCHRGGDEACEEPESGAEAREAAEAGQNDDAVMISDNEKEDSPETLRGDAPAGETPGDGEPHPHPHPHHPHHPHHHGHPRGPGPHRHGRGGGRGGRGGRRHSGPPHAPFPYPAGFPGHMIAQIMRGLSNNPGAQVLRQYAEQARAAFQPNIGAAANNNNNNNNNADAADVEVFTPPVDIFNTDRAYVLHVALPGAKKEDVGVDWDADRNNLRVAGVVHRPGDEAFLATLASGERRIGVFERDVTLPPEGVPGVGPDGEKEEVDGLGITAKMEDGVLVIVVPKLEREWTEVRKVDIE